MPQLETLMPFFNSEQKGDMEIGHHKVACVRTRATLSSVEEYVGRDRVDGGAKEGDSVVRYDADGAQKTLRELEVGACHRCRQRHPFMEGSCIFLPICETLADPGD